MNAPKKISCIGIALILIGTLAYFVAKLTLTRGVDTSGIDFISTFMMIAGVIFIGIGCLFFPIALIVALAQKIRQDRHK